MKINSSYLCYQIKVLLDNYKPFYNDISKSRRSCRAIVWNALMYIANERIREIEYPYNQDFTCTSAQLKNWLTRYGNGYDTLLEAIEDAEQARKEYKEV